MGLLVKVEAELEQVVIVEVIPGHPQVLADSVFTGALPGLDAESTFLKDIVDFNL